MTDGGPFRVGIALEGVGRHPASWPYSAGVEPTGLFTGDHR
ncbi:hypothetical protein ABZ871_24830 [Streptomyces populi]